MSDKARAEAERRYEGRAEVSLSPGAVRNARREAFERGARWARDVPLADPTDDRYTLAEARAIINAEKCVRDWNGPWCTQHDAHWPDSEEECRARPEVADVAAQLLATMERTTALTGKWEATAADLESGALYPQRAAVAYRRAVTDLRDAINGEEVEE